MNLRALILVLCVAATAAASTLDDYKKRLDDASQDVLQTRSAEDQRDRATAETLVAAITREIPATERVEWPGGSVETDNSWLTVAIESYRVETTRTKRWEILDGIRERLQAESQAVQTLQQGIAHDSTKDADKQKLAEILSRAEYQPPKEEEEGLAQRLWNRFWKWIDDLFPKPAIQPSESTAFGSLRLILQILIFAVAAGLIAFLLWRFLPFLKARFGRRRAEKHGDRVILGEIVGADESATDIFAEAERLAREGDIRGAIRKGYIAVLCELGDRRFVRLARHKTNRDYLRDVKRTPQVFEGLRGLTDNFERNWYGIRSTPAEDWEAFRDGYDRTLREARG
jgi:hypothetical protein